MIKYFLMTLSILVVNVAYSQSCNVVDKQGHESGLFKYKNIFPQLGLDNYTDKELDIVNDKIGGRIIVCEDMKGSKVYIGDNYWDLGGEENKAESKKYYQKYLELNPTDIPDKVLSLGISTDAGGFYWTKLSYACGTNLNNYISKNPNNIRQVSICVNGKNKQGEPNGLSDRVKYFNIIKKEWGLK